MDALVPVGFVLLVVAVFGTIATLGTIVLLRGRRASADQANLGALAHQYGWQYVPASLGFADRFVGEPMPRWSRNLPTAHVVTGQVRGRPFSCFQFTRTAVGSNRDHTSRTEHFRVFAVRLPAAVPTLRIRRAGFGIRLLQRAGVRGIVLGDPQFDPAFRVSGDEAFARAVLTPQLRHWLLADPRTRRGPLRFERDELVTWSPGRLTASSIPPALDYLCDVLDRVPARWPAAS